MPTPFPTLHHDSEDLPFPQPLRSATRAQSGGPENPAPSFSQMEANGNQFGLLEWYPHFQSCVKYFLEHVQHSPPIQAVAAFSNIQLPFQKAQRLLLTSRTGGSPSTMPSPTSRATGKLPMHMQSPNQTPAVLTLNPYIRRLVATGFDFPAVLHGFFGDSWALGIGPMHEVERGNYLFAAKSASWLDVKSHYGMGEEQIPFLRHSRTSRKRKLSAPSRIGASGWRCRTGWLGRGLLGLTVTSPLSISKRKMPGQLHSDRFGRMHFGTCSEQAIVSLVQFKQMV